MSTAIFLEGSRENSNRKGGPGFKEAGGNRHLRGKKKEGEKKNNNQKRGQKKSFVR